MFSRKIAELEEELKVVGNNMRSLEIAEQEVRSKIMIMVLFGSLTTAHAQLTFCYMHGCQSSSVPYNHHSHSPIN